MKNKLLLFEQLRQQNMMDQLCRLGETWINKYNIIQLMKQQRATKQRRQLSQGLPAIENNGINQTIIINNPNFNINYIDHSAYNAKPSSRANNNKTIQQLPLYDPKNSSKGIDAWNLNKNLKQFSQTRQLGFFKGNSSKTKSNSDLQNSPYLSHKKTAQQIKPYMKIKPSGTIEPSSFRQNKTISTIKQQAMLITQRDRSALSNNHPSIEAQDQSKTTFRKRKFQSKPRHPRPQIPDLGETGETINRQEIDITQTFPNGGSQTERKISPIALATRRNRFVDLDKPILQKTGRKNNENEEQADVSDLQNSLIIGDSSPRKTKTPKQPISSNTKVKSKAIERSIQKISKCFLSKVDNYFDVGRNNELPSSKIELYTTTVHQPTSYSYNIDYKSSGVHATEAGYDFQFEEEKLKNRPRTPYKRKKMYEEII